MHTPTARTAVLALVVATVTISCASTAAIRSATAVDHAEGSASDVITASELKHLDPGLSVLEAIEHARPWFLHSRGSVSTVSIDHSPPTESSVLRTLFVGDVKEIRLLRGTSSSGLVSLRPNGTVAVGDVVLVVTAAGRS